MYMYENGSARTRSPLRATTAVGFVVALDLSVVNVALPQIDAALGFAALDLTWVIHAYALTFGGLLLLGGGAADRFGRRRLLLSGLLLFAVASLLGGLAQEPSQLLIARAAQGVGAAALTPASLAALSDAFPSGARRARAFGIWGAMNGAGGAIGMVIGGLLVEYADWRWVMLVNVPLCLICLVMVRRDVADTRPVRIGRPDVLGGLLATLGAGVLVFGIVRADQIGWASIATLLTLAGGVGLLALFVAVEARTARPLLRLGLLRNRFVAGSNLFNLLVGAALSSAFYFVSLYLQLVLGHGAARTGWEILPFAVGLIAGSVLAGRLGARVPARTLLMAGALCAAAGFAWFSRIDASGTFLADVLGPSLVASVGSGICLATIVRTATAGVATEEAGVASGLLNSSRQLGATLGLAALGAAAASRTGDQLDPAGLAAGYGWGLVLCALLLAAAAVMAFVMPAAEPRPAAVPEAQQEPAT